MAEDNHEFKDIMDKLKSLSEKEKLDLSADEDLCVGIMNLISLEEHLFFTGEKTGACTYLDMLNRIRHLRKDLLKRLIKEYEGEAWCIAKHLLAASMRLMEVGTKQLAEGDNEDANYLFRKSFELYSLFWVVKFKSSDISTKETEEKPKEDEEERREFTEEMGELVGAGINCCVEYP